MSEALINPNVSVVITAYNAARWIKETLDSVLAQTYRDFEVIVIDDGSTDETADVVASYGRKVCYFHQENGGQPSARNVGIRKACGSYVAFVDADDLWLPKKLELQMGLLTVRRDIMWVYCDAFYYDTASRCVRKTASQLNKMVDGDVLRQLFMVDFIPSPTPVVKKEVFDIIGYFDESSLLRIGEDWNMWLKIAAKYRIGYVPQPLAIVRCHVTSMIGSMNLSVSLQSRMRIVEQAVSREPERLKDLRKPALVKTYISIALYMLARAADCKETRKIFLQAFKLDPFCMMAVGGLIVTFFPPSTIGWIKAMRRYMQTKYCNLKHNLHGNRLNEIFRIIKRK